MADRLQKWAYITDTPLSARPAQGALAGVWGTCRKKKRDMDLIFNNYVLGTSFAA